MNLSDITSRVQALHDDQEGTYCTPELVASHAQQQYEVLFNRLYLSDSQFDEQVIEIPGVAAGTTDLSAFLKPGQPLEFLVTPRTVEWRFPGLDATNYRVARGPLDAVRDVAAGMPSLDSWAWIRRNLFLSQFGVALDLRITGTTLFDPLTDQNSLIQMDITANAVLAYMIAKAIAQAHGMPTLIKEYRQESDDAFDDLFIAKVKADQSRTRRVARISRRRLPRTASPAVGSAAPTTSVIPVPTVIVALQNSAIAAGVQYALVEASGGAAGITISLPDATQSKGNKITIEKMDASNLGAVTVQPTGGQTMSGQASWLLVNQYQFVTVESDGANWLITANN